LWQLRKAPTAAPPEARKTRRSVVQRPQHESVRVEACESCKIKTYVKSIERWTQGAEIDDLVALSLDPWATSQGYQRLEPGLAGL